MLKNYLETFQKRSLNSKKALLERLSNSATSHLEKENQQFIGTILNLYRSYFADNPYDYNRRLPTYAELREVARLAILNQKRTKFGPQNELYFNKIQQSFINYIVLVTFSANKPGTDLIKLQNVFKIKNQELFPEMKEFAETQEKDKLLVRLKNNYLNPFLRRQAFYSNKYGRKKRKLYETELNKFIINLVNFFIKNKQKQAQPSQNF